MTKSIHAGRQGYALVPIVLMLAILASVSLLINLEGGLGSRAAARELESDQSRYLAEAGYSQARWLLSQNTNCTGYTNLPATALGPHSYSVEVTPQSGSPVTLTATGILASGAKSTIRRTVGVVPSPTTLVLQPGSEGIDTYLWAGRHDGTNFGTSSTLMINNASAEQTTLLKFDLSSLPTNVVIQSAMLELRVHGGGNNVTNAVVDVHHVSRAWVEGIYDDQSPPAGGGATYQSYDGQTNWTTPGGDFDSPAVSSVTISTLDPAWYAWNVTDSVAAWFSGTIPNDGLIVRTSAGEADKIPFFSSDHTTSANHPKLTVTYACECGVVCVGPVALTLPLAHWKLDDGSGDDAVDSVGGHDGKLQGGDWVTGQVGGGLELDGINDRVEVPGEDELVPTNQMTLMAWVRAASFGGGYQTVLDQDAGGTGSTFWFGTWQNELDFGFWADSEFREVFTSGLALTVGTWYHVAASFDNATDEVKLYVDGTLVHTGAMAFDPSPEKADITIGRSIDGDYWNGRLDDVRIYDVVLSEAEISQIAADGGKAVSACATVVTEDFEASDFKGNTGSGPWSGPWQEINESDGFGTGDEMVLRIVSLDSQVLRVQDNDGGGEGAMRFLDASGHTTGTLSFGYQRTSMGNSDNYVTVDVSGDDGATWTELDRFAGPDNDNGLVSTSYDISAFLGSKVAIRFLGSPLLNRNDRVYFDDIEICLD